jgi:periplasmic protein TonB
MQTGNVQVGKTQGNPPAGGKPSPDAQYRLTMVDQPFVLSSLFRSIAEWLREPKITVPKQYYRGEASLPLSEMRPWYKDLPSQIRSLFEKPKPSLIPLTSQPVEVPNIWGDYPQQPASWVNSLLFHAIVVAAVVIPYFVSKMMEPPKAKAEYNVNILSPYIPDLPPGPKKAGGGGGGGDRTPLPASKGPVPKFKAQQITPPVAVITNPDPKMPAAPSLVGPENLKVPQMQASITFGDPLGVNGPASNGPGFGGGIGSGEGTGIGSGKGGGLGPGEGGGTGGGVFSVGGGVSAPIGIYMPEPPYSEEARKAKFQGVVVLSIIVDAQGNVRDPRVVRRLGLGLDEKAEETVRTWKFKAAQRNGVPVPVRVMVEVTFRLF